MSIEELREVARAQNDADHQAGLLPSRHVEDRVVLGRVAALVLEASTAERAPQPAAVG